MLFRALASGSNGNCSVLATDDGSLLIDAGISRKRIIEGLMDLSIPLHDVNYVLITHAHSDHINGLPVLSRFLDFKVVATPDTIDELRKLAYRDIRFEKVADEGIEITHGSIIELDNFIISSLPTLHDIAGASGFGITDKKSGITMCYTTDTGELSYSSIQAMREADFLVLESNHDLDMLKNSRRPYWLKKRIRETHLSNKETIEYLTKIIGPNTKGVFLAHLSGECNTPDLVSQTIHQFRESYSDHADWEWIVCTRWDSSSILKMEREDFRFIGGWTSITKPPDLTKLNEKISSELENFF